jgi:hypothetical protein
MGRRNSTAESRMTQRRILILGSALLTLAICSAPWLARAAAAITSIPNDREVAGPLDGAINALLRHEGLTSQMTSAVVPIVGYNGSDATLRLAQINGPAAAVNRVTAVLEVDNEADHDKWQFTALIPVASVTGGGRGHRVDGVGVTAILTK